MNSSLTALFLSKRSNLTSKLSSTLSVKSSSAGKLCGLFENKPGMATPARFLSDDSKNGGKNGINSSDEDPFGVNYIDADSDNKSEESTMNNIGPKDDLPPNYIRDSATGKFTGRIQKEISEEEASLLKLSPLAKERLLAKKYTDTIEKSKLEVSSRRIREQEIALNTLGRKVSDVSAATDINSVEGDGTFSAPLSEAEYKSLEKFMQKNVASDSHKNSINSLLRDAQNEDLIPIARKSSARDATSLATKDENNPDLDLEWTTLTAQRSMGDVDDEDLEDPLANLMPSDLNPAKKVNRKRAKPLPKELLHHNNLALLRRYVTPGGQIMNRVQSRLGAKDQRKIAKLVKRARNLGLIPVIGQWKVEDHGNIKEDDILENRDWEQELLERGLIKAKSPVYGGKDNDTSEMW